MTLTKYQRGESIEGWNDCPVYIPSSSSTSSLNSSSSRTSRKRPPRRIGHNIDGTPITSGSLTPSSVGISYPTPPIPTKNLTSSVSLEREFKPANSTSSSKNNVDIDCNTVIDDTNLNMMLNELLRHPTTLQENEIKHYQNKLKNVVSTLSDNNKLFLSDVLVKVLKNPSGRDETSIATSKQEILVYMMANQGVSNWCAPLKKTIEGLKVNT